MAFRKSFKKGFGNARRSFGNARRRVSSFGGRARRRMTSFNPMSITRIVRVPRGLPLSRQINQLLPFAMIGAALYFFVPQVKEKINQIFKK